MTITNQSAERRDVWWVEELCGKRRPAIVVSNDFYNANPRNAKIMVIPLTSLKSTTDIRDDELLIDPSESGLECWSLTMVMEVQTVKREQLVEWVGCISVETAKLLDECIRFSLALAS